MSLSNYLQLDLFVPLPLTGPGSVPVIETPLYKIHVIIVCANYVLQLLFTTQKIHVWLNSSIVSQRH